MPDVSVWPRSLLGRIVALYSTALVVFVFGSVTLFARYQFRLELAHIQLRADTLTAAVAPAVTDSAVIGDHEAIRRMLQRASRQFEFASASFIGADGTALTSVHDEAPDVRAPAWLRNLVARRLVDTNQPISALGRDYGVLRFAFAPERIAGGLWGRGRVALGLAASALAGGLLLIWLPLTRWLRDLRRIRSFEDDLRSGTPQALADDAPIEFKRTFDVLSRAAANLQVQREQAAVTLGVIADGVFTLDTAGRVVLVNPAACAALAMPAQEILGRHAHELMPELFDGQALQACAPWRDRRVSIAARGGSERVLDTTLSSITGADGEHCGHVLACHDVSEQHALDQRLQEELRSRGAALAALRSVLEGLIPQSAGRRDPVGGDIEAISQMISTLVQRMHEHGEQLNAIFALSPDGFVSFDRERTVNYVSPAFTRLTGLDDSEVLGLDEAQFALLLRERCAGAAMPDFETLRGQEQDRRGSAARRHLMNVERPTRRTLEVSVRHGDGATISQVLHLRDVTHESEVDQLKSEFLSTAAHELRTPMTSIYGFAELMMHRQLSAERQKEVISTVHRQTGVMISIVNELLDLARIEARRGKDFRLELVDLRTLVAGVVRDFKPPNERALPETSFPQTEVKARVDLGKLAQALGNVLSNAYKYSPAGGAVHIALHHHVADRRVALVVADRGIGMTRQQLSRVSERFYRADTSGSIPGTGLGMSIVKEIIELLGGSLELASAPGEGTQVTLWLPCAEGG